MSKEKQSTYFRLEKEYVEKIDEIALNEYTSRSQVIRKLVICCLEKNSKI
ncbi:MAG: ribbon-helix-helix protein, CopG family [Methanobacterium sp.]